MGREPNSVNSNVVKGLLDFSEQDPQLELNPSDFLDELDSTVLVRDREPAVQNCSHRLARRQEG